MSGLFGGNATLWSDINLILQLAMGIALLAGMFLAKKKQFRAHGICQSAVITLNLAAIGLFMLPTFKRGVVSQIPAKLGDPFYGVASAHAAIGTIAELLGLYIILCAGTSLIPESLRFSNYKRWMRTELIIWWIVIFFGIGTYGVWYAMPAKSASTTAAEQTPPKDEAKTITIEIGNFSFEPKEVTIPAGTTVVWVNKKGRHSVFADDKSFESQVMAVDEKYSRKFDAPGKIAYYCSIHGSAGGHDMAGTITVEPKK
jgi:plastocyanin/uncharacterized membrane protein YozB (DUF420 family)